MIKGFFKLIRIPNLIIMALTQYLFRYCILLPLMAKENIEPAFGHGDFALLVWATLLIASAGYAINDYFDIRIDHINKPDRIIVGRLISRRKAMFVHVTFNIMAVIVAAYLSYRVHNFKLVSFFVIITILLWAYSLKYKAYFLVGNLIVAFVSAFTILIVWIFEKTALTSNLLYVYDKYGYLNFLLWAYFIFAFVTSLMREIIKDIEDIEGDRKVGCSTMPVVMGVSKTKIVIYFLCTFAIAALSFATYKAYNLPASTHINWYAPIILILPYIYMFYSVIKAKDKKDFSFLSTLTKFTMVAGVASMAIVFSLF